MARMARKGPFEKYTLHSRSPSHSPETRYNMVMKHIIQFPIYKRVTHKNKKQLHPQTPIYGPKHLFSPPTPITPRKHSFINSSYSTYPFAVLLILFIYSFNHLTHILETGLRGLKKTLTSHYTTQTPLYTPKHPFSPAIIAFRPSTSHQNTPLLIHLTLLLFY